MRKLAAAVLVVGVGAATLRCTSLAGLSNAPEDAGDAGLGVETGAPADAGAAGFACEAGTGEYPFCVDFDHGPVETGWNARLQDLDGSVFLWTDHWASPPNSLLATVITGRDAGGGNTFGHTFTGPSAPASFTLDFDLWVEHAEGGNFSDPVQVQFGAQPQAYVIELALDATAGLQLAEFDDMNAYGAVSLDQLLPVSASAWHHVEMTADLVAATVVISSDGLSAHGKLGAAGVPIRRFPPTLWIGLPFVYGAASNDWRVAFDDVRFDVR